MSGKYVLKSGEPYAVIELLPWEDGVIKNVVIGDMLGVFTDKEHLHLTYLAEVTEEDLVKLSNFHDNLPKELEGLDFPYLPLEELKEIRELEIQYWKSQTGSNPRQ